MDSLIILSLNCHGLGNLQKRRDVFHYLKQKGHSVYCLQDTHFDKKIEKYVTSECVLCLFVCFLFCFCII